ncbi:MAG: hypothetical protein RI883_977 [Bacteroidota bacterium]|jgi:OOP family OmpA-OmpF porin
MKKILLLSIISMSFTVFSQDMKDMNKWSVGLGVGGHDGLTPAKMYTKVYQLHHIGANGRYMFNNRFGLMLDMGFDLFDANGSGKSNIRYLRTSVQGVLNLGDLLRSDTWTKSIGLLMHGGAGMSHMWVGKNDPLNIINANDPLLKNVDDMLNYVIGITPQFKINEHFALTGDLSFIAHSRQTHNFNMTELTPARTGFDGYLFNYTIGVSYYFGKKAKHADWTPTVYGGSAADNSQYEKIVRELEEKTKDDDADGVPNFRDIELTTQKNAYVNSKGEALKDTDNDGIADVYDLCPELKGTFSLDGCVDSDGDGIGDSKDVCPDVAGNLINKGCPEITKEVKDVMTKALKGVQFESNKDILTPASLPILDDVVRVLKTEEHLNLQIHGHTDNQGEDQANLILSKARALAVNNYLVKNGIAQDRLENEGFGETLPIASNDTDKGRAQNRRVEFKVIIE